MIRLRMPIAQLPNITRNSDRNGRNQWLIRSSMNTQDHDGCSDAEKLRPTGKMPATFPSAQASSIASHMYGVAVRMYQTGRTVLSSTFFRAAYAPNLLPAHQLRRMAGNSSPSVYGSAARMIEPTGWG